MFQLTFTNDSVEFLNYLKNECISFDENFTFNFKNETSCIDIISRYFLFIIREDFFSKYKLKFNLTDDDLADVNLIITSKDSIDILREIKARVLNYVHETSVFHYNGFFSFRLSEQKKKIENLVFNALEQISLLKVSDSNLVDLKRIVAFSEKKIDKILVDSNMNEILVYNKHSLIFSEPKMNEDFVLSQIITLNPHSLHIKKNTFSLESEEIIDFVFSERSYFYDNRHELFED